MGESNDKPSHGDCLVDDDDIEILVGEVTRSIVDGMISIQLSERIQTLAAKNFSPSQPYPSKVIAWIRRHGLPATLYKRSLIKEIGNCIGHVVRIDYQTKSGLLNTNPSLLYASSVASIGIPVKFPRHIAPPSPTSKLTHDAASSAFGSWMLVEKRQRQLAKKPHTNEARQHDDVASGSRFNPLYLDGEEAQVDGNIPNSGQVNDYVPLSPRNTRKGKQPITVKQLRAVNVRKPLTISVNDFPIIPWSALKASSSRSTRASHKVTILDKSRHSAIVLPENSNPNLQLVTSAQDFPSSRKNVHTMGDPPDVDMKLLPSLPVKDPGDVLNDLMFNDRVQFESHEILLGDRNTRYFHRRAVCRKQQNRVSSLRLLNAEVESNDDFPLNDMFLVLSPSIAQHFDDIPTSQEIHEALKEMAPLKAPGWDDLHAEFFQKQWKTVGPFVCNAIQHVFR
ncbi:hypothetical protein GQ457_09G010950 [Hibiscus cannabinus]